MKKVFAIRSLRLQKSEVNGSGRGMCMCGICFGTNAYHLMNLEYFAFEQLNLFS